MLWPVLLNTHPREATWSLGERVTTRLRWLDHPELPDDLVLTGAVETRSDVKATYLRRRSSSSPAWD
jgi:hypothetical protein